MNKRQIAENIDEKIDDLVKSIDDPDIANTIDKHAIIAGGCIASMLLGEDIRDYDVYFDSAGSAEKVAKYYVERFGDGSISVVHEGVSGPFAIDVPAGIEVNNEGTDKYRPICVTEHAVTLANNVQIVLRFCYSVEDIINVFDFIHCKNVWHDGSVTFNSDAIESILTRDLVYTGSSYPLASLIRMRKFIKRGWNINAGQILKIVFDLQKLDLNDYDVLRNQLVGVDTAFFSELLIQMRQEKPHNLDTFLTRYIDAELS